ncbi:MAG TPA: methylenetetrahydrofolate reductase [NAD(P)H] [Nitrospiraceae bacterium]|nr:methylenetetrahydrofolate reductase [NAD(P)H] [Nitrospiraceae bacterium]
MGIKELFKERKRGVAFEFFPPKSPKGKESFMQVVNDLKQYDPLYVSVTYGAGGSTREGTVNTLKWIKQDTNLTVMSHLTGIGATPTSMDMLLRDYMAHGIDNILALRGDPPRNMPGFDLTRGDFKYAKDLVKFVKKFAYFTIAVAVYPEGHQESPSIEKDMEYTKQKIDEGADFAITQMFFDNRYYYDFMERAGKIGISIPIFPGIMPITDCRKIEDFADFCSATIPKEIREKMAPLLDKPGEMAKLGIEYALKQCEDLVRNGVRYFHFYTMNKAAAAREILHGLAGLQ